MTAYSVPRVSCWRLAVRTQPIALLLIACVTGTMALAVTPPTMPVAPRYEVVDALGATDFVVDIAVDPAGLRPALVYYDSTRADLLVPSQIPVRLARYDRFARTVTTLGFVNGRTGNDRDLRLAIDALGGAHALAIETNELGGADDALVYFGSDAQGAPIREQIDSINVSQITLAVDFTHEPYVAYIKNGGSFGAGTLVVRRRAGGTWQPITLDATPANATHPSFAPNPADAFLPMHLAWAETAPTGSAIRHARVSTQFAVTDTVEQNAVQFSLHQPQLVVDPFGTLEVAYVASLSGASTVQLRRRQFDKSTWQCIDTGCALPTGSLPGSFGLSAHAFVQGALNFGSDGVTHLLRREGANWVDYPFTALLNAQGAALDRFGNVYTTGIDRSTHRDLFLARVGGPWEQRARIPADPSIQLSHPLDVASDLAGHPVVYARRSCCVPDPRGALWIIGAGNDFVEYPLPGSLTVEAASIAVAPDGVIHLALYDGDQDDLVHAEFTPDAGGGNWTMESVDTQGDVGASPTMLIGKDGRPMIVYRRRPDLLHLALRSGGGSWEIRGMGTGVGETSQPTAVASREDYLLHASWFDEDMQKLRIVSWRGDPLVAQNVLSADVLPTSPGHVEGRLHDIALLGDGGVAVAHTDETAGQAQLGYSYRDYAGQWFDGSAPEPFSAAPITRVSLDTTLQSPTGARVAWIVGARLHYAEKHIGFDPWDSEDLGTIPVNAPVHLGAAGPLRITYNEGNGLQLLQRLEPLGVNNNLVQAYGYSESYPAPICRCFLGPLENCFASPEPGVPEANLPTYIDGAVIPAGSAAAPPAQILQGMRDLFNTTPAGRYYLQLFRTHAAEIIGLTLSNPGMLLERTRTLSDLLPGFAALIESPAQGNLYRFTPDLIANSRFVVQGWRNAGSPALRLAIDNEFARTAAFNQFTGMTFTEWFESISVGNAFDPLFADGFE